MNKHFYSRSNMGNGNFKTATEPKIISQPNLDDTWKTYQATGELDYRGRAVLVDPDTGKRYKHKPNGKFNDAFDVEVVSWTFAGIDRTGKVTEFKTASGERERQYRSEMKNEYIFS